MLRELRQVLRLILMMGKQSNNTRFRRSGGLLVLLSTGTGSSPEILNCTVAAAGCWCAGMKMTSLQPDLRDRMFPPVWPCPEIDPEELSAFTDLYGSLKLLMGFQITDESYSTADWGDHIEAFLQSFNLTNAAINIHLKFRFNERTSQREFRVKVKSIILQVFQASVILDVSHSAQLPQCVRNSSWCQGAHHVIGSRLPLSIPPQAMDQGLFGELSIQFVSLLSPCLLQYPNLPTELTRVQVLVYSPSNIPVPGPSGFLQALPVALDCQLLGLDRVYCSSFKASAADLKRSCGTEYTVEEDSWEYPELESSRAPAPVQQSLVLFLFLQHNDPFTCQLSDLLATEVLIEQHLEDILCNNRRAVTAALQFELWNTLKAQNRRKKATREGVFIN
ncbi:type 2 DNA topoisomerase 6 subunit B-like [Menidia menidia]